MYGAFIRTVRLSRGLSQVELASVVGIEQPNLSAYENDRQLPSADMLNRILVACGYLLEAVAGKRRIRCPLPNADWFADSSVVSLHGSTDGAIPLRAKPDDELRALQLEQVLALADVLRESKAAT